MMASGAFLQLINISSMVALGTPIMTFKKSFLQDTVRFFRRDGDLILENGAIFSVPRMETNAGGRNF